MKKPACIVVAVALMAALIACNNPNSTAPGPHATVFLRDGSSYSGRVTKSSPSELTMAGDDQSNRTFAMTDVRSVEYDTNAPAPAAPAQSASAPASPSGQPSTAAPAPPAASQAADDRLPDDHYHPDASTIQTKTYELETGANVSVRTEETIDSGRAVEGQTYAAEVWRDVRDADGNVVIPRGSNAQLVIRSASRGGRFRGTSDLVLDLTSVSVDGREYRLSARTIQQRGKDGIGKNERTAKFVGGGALLGTVIGAIAGHGKGAAIGAISGAAAGGAAQLATRGGSIHVPAETVLTFRLDQPLQVQAVQ
jgi:hypothetical protein